MKLCFVLPSVPHYRKGLFESLGNDDKIQGLTVLGGYGASRKVIKPLEEFSGFDVSYQKLSSFSLGPISIKYQGGLLRKILKERPSHVIMLYHMSIISHTLVPLLCRILGIHVYFWGSGSGEDPLIRGKELGGLIKLKLLYKRAFYRLFDGIIVYSNMHMQRLRSQKVSLPICVAQNTLDIDGLLGIPLVSGSSNSLLFVGALEAVKRLDVLIKALVELREYEWRLDIIGSGSKEESLKKLTEDLELGSRITFHGALYAEDTIKYWKNASHVVLPGVGGLLINEAMAAGKYVLATSGDGTGQDLLVNSDILSHDVNERDLTRRLERLLNLSESEFVERSSRNREFARNNLRINGMKTEILNLLMSTSYE